MQVLLHLEVVKAAPSSGTYRLHAVHGVVFFAGRRAGVLNLGALYLRTGRGPLMSEGRRAVMTPVSGEGERQQARSQDFAQRGGDVKSR